MVPGGDQGAYQELREGFLECHRVGANVFLHIITGFLGAAGVLALAYSCSNRSLVATGLLTSLYAVSLLSSTAPLGLVLVVLTTLVLVMALVRFANLGIAGSLAAVVIGYLGQDAAHHFSGEKTFQSTYSDDVIASVSGALTWIAAFSRHTFFLLPLTVDAAVEILASRDHFPSSFFGVNETVNETLLATPLPAWLLAVRENAWVLTFLAVWVAGCYLIDSDSGPFPWMFVKGRVLGVNLEADGLRKDLAAIRKWATNHDPSKDTTTHWWFTDLPSGELGERAAFTRVAECSEIDAMFREKFTKGTYCIETIPGMNEVYVSGPPKSLSSDAVFTTSHIDGPWALVPFCSTYRCILGLDSSAVYTTVFPNVTGLTKTCRTGDIVCFDYNREIHYIEGYAKAKEEQARLAPAEGGDGFRIVLKLHYCVYPRVLWPLGKLAAALSTWYNILFRNLFQFTLAPSSVFSRVMAFFVVQVTILYRMIIETGLHNLLYVAALFAMGRLVHPNVFLVGTSFVHYPRYITTYYHRGSDVNFGAFKSDSMFFKVVALSHIAYRYVSALLRTLSSGTAAAAAAVAVGGALDTAITCDGQNTTDACGDSAHNNHAAAVVTALVALSLAMIAAGSAVSILATKALGVDGTYFGPELGICEMKWVSVFPYNCIPHPMIVGQLVAFLGVHLLPEFRAAWPWLMPAHCALYAVVMAQEHLDVYGGASTSGRVAGYNGEEGAAVQSKKDS